MVYFLVFVVWYGVFVIFLEFLCANFLLRLPMAIGISWIAIGPACKKLRRKALH